MVYLDWALAAARGENSGVLVADGAFAVLYALAEALSDHGTTQFQRRGRWPGHMFMAFTRNGMEIVGQVQLLLELHNGTVAVAAGLGVLLAATPRPRAPISAHPLGYSAGPDYGGFQHAVSHSEIRARWGSEMAFARTVAGWLSAPRTSDAPPPLLGDYR